jgi:hypothetical protein
MNNPNDVGPLTEAPTPRRRSGVEILRRWLIGLVCLVALVALGYLVENWRGQRAWERFRREMAAQGEKLDMASLAPPPVPEAQNLAMSPLFHALATDKPAKDGSADREGLDHLRRISEDLRMPGKTNKLSVGTLQRGTYTDLEACRRFYQENSNYPQPEKPGSAAQDVLAALSLFAEEFKELAEGAAARPACRFPVNYSEEPSSMILLPHLSIVKRIAAVNQLRAIARLELGQTREALADVNLGFRLADGLREEPLLFSQLVRIAMIGFNLQIIREGLMRQAWNDAQLAELERLLAAEDLLADYKHCMRGERACTLGTLDFMRRRTSLAGIADYVRRKGTLAEINSTIWGPDDGDPFQRLLLLAPTGWYYQNMAFLGRLYQDRSLPAVDAASHRFFPGTDSGVLPELEAHKHSPYRFFAAVVFPTVGRAATKAAQMQTFLDEARVACAVERQRLAQGKYPDTLTSLAPQFLSRIPTDLFDGQPLRYRSLPEGGYVVYSIGLNQKDDGGEMAFAKQSNAPDDSQGDWVWQMAGKRL